MADRVFRDGDERTAGAERHCDERDAARVHGARRPARHAHVRVAVRIDQRRRWNLTRRTLLLRRRRGGGREVVQQQGRLVVIAVQHLQRMTWR